MEFIQNKMNDFLYSMINFDYIGFIGSMMSLLTFESFLKLLVMYFFIIWIALIIWVTKDIINRTNSILYQVFSIFTVLFGTPLGIVIYLLIRPSKTLFEKYYDESALDEALSLNDFRGLDLSDDEEIMTTIPCPHCEYGILPEYRYCPNCREPLKRECIACHHIIKPEWNNCPYCGKDQEKRIENILNTPEPPLTKTAPILEDLTPQKSKKNFIA